MKEKRYAANVIKRAIKKLENVGWTKHKFRAIDNNNKVCGYCASAALRTSENPRAQGIYGTIARNAVDSAIEEKGYYSLISFNDDIAKNKREVISLFKRAIKRLEAE